MSREKIEVITYEEDRLNYFTELMKKSQKRYKRLFKKFRNAPYLSAESEMLSDAGRETQFHGDVVEMLEKKNEIKTLYDRIKAMPLDEMASFFVYLEQNHIITVADRYICRKCKLEHGNHCPIGDDDKCLYDLSDKETIKLWLKKGAYEYDDT